MATYAVPTHSKELVLHLKINGWFVRIKKGEKGAKHANVSVARIQL